MSRRQYDLQIVVNDIEIKKVVIDPHFEKKHSASISDEIILELVKMLDGKSFRPVDAKGPYSYFVNEGMVFKSKAFRLVWLLEEHNLYVGVVNAYRR